MSSSDKVGYESAGEADFDDDEDDYYDYNTDMDAELQCLKGASAVDPEFFKYDELQLEEVERLLNESVDKLSKTITVEPCLAKLLLQTSGWHICEIVTRYQSNPPAVLKAARVLPDPTASSRSGQSASSMLSSGNGASSSSRSGGRRGQSSRKGATASASSSTACAATSTSLLAAAAAAQSLCDVCMSEKQRLYGLKCSHMYCASCWMNYLTVQLDRGVATEIECMGDNCNLLCTENFVLDLLAGSRDRDRYMKFAFRDMVQSHPQLRFCPGTNCSVVIRAPEPKAKRVKCRTCGTEYCFQCSLEYHAPTDCETIQKWLTKCRDDSETANYISANTKDCPQCHVCIEKNGGCNHMMCSKCKYEFCWMCMGDWKTHQAEYYECSRYKENPNIANECYNVQARDALKKYLFYYERWENHEKSLRLEDEQLARIKARINAKVMNKEGTWIDWQHLLTAAETLRRCRYTLKYTYPYAYYMEKKPRKELFEYQQGLLEVEVENLSWKIEHAEITDRGDLENKMDVCEKHRLTLLHEFQES